MLGCFYFTLPAHPLGWSTSCPLRQPFPQALPFPSGPGHRSTAPVGAISPAVGKWKPLLLQKPLVAAARGNPVFYQAGKQRRSPRPAWGTRSEGGDASSFVSVNGLWLLQQWMFKPRSWVLGLAFAGFCFLFSRSPMKLGCLSSGSAEGWASGGQAANLVVNWGIKGCTESALLCLLLPSPRSPPFICRIP